MFALLVVYAVSAVLAGLAGLFFHVPPLPIAHPFPSSNTPQATPP